MIDINEPGIVQLRREQCVRGLAHCRVLQGAVLVEGFTFKEKDDYEIAQFTFEYMKGKIVINFPDNLISISLFFHNQFYFLLQISKNV